MRFAPQIVSIVKFLYTKIRSNIGLRLTGLRGGCGWFAVMYTVQSPYHTYTKHNLIQYVLWTDPSLPTHRKKSVNVCIFTPPRQGSSVLRSVSVCVCLSVCLSASIFLEPLERSSRNFCADPRGRFLKGWVSLSPNFRQKGRRPPNTVGVKN